MGRIVEEGSSSTRVSPQVHPNHPARNKFSPVEETSELQESVFDSRFTNIGEIALRETETENLNENAEMSQSATRTNIGTQNFGNFERLVFAITDDDVTTFSKFQIQLEDLAKLEFEGGTNILNFAIENERVSIIQHLASLTEERPEIREELLNHRFRPDQLCAVHQVMAAGNRTMINLILNEFGESLEPRTNNNLSVLHIAA